MGIKKIIKDIESIFSKKEFKKSHCEDLGELLDELEQKQKKLQAELESESNKKKRKKIKMDLKVVTVQLRKGRSKREALKGCQ